LGFHEGVELFNIRTVTGNWIASLRIAY